MGELGGISHMSENSNGGGMGTPSTTTPWVIVVVAVLGLIGTSLNAWSQYKGKVDAQSMLVEAEKRPDLKLAWPAKYEWQVGEAGWLGHVSINENGGADISATRYSDCNGKRRALTLLRQEGTGTASLRDNGKHLSVSIPVRFIKYDNKCRNVGEDSRTVLTGTLDLRAAYSGQIDYQNDFGTPQGGMVLVNESSIAREP
jgi:hypothetical protein